MDRRVIVGIMTCLLWSLGAYAQHDHSPETVSRLIQQLGAPDFEVREYAMREIEKIGEAARPALEKALNHTDPEVVWRARQLLEDISANTEDPPEQDPPAQERPLQEIPDRDAGPKVRGFGGNKTYSWKTPGFSFSFSYRSGPGGKGLSNLRVIQNNTRYEYEWKNHRLHVGVTDLNTRKTSEYEFADIEELREAHPELYRIYMANNPSFTTRRQPFGRGFRGPDMYGRVPLHMREQMRRFEQEMRRHFEGEAGRRFPWSTPQRGWRNGEEKLVPAEPEPFVEKEGGASVNHGICVKRPADAVKFQLDLPDECLLVTEVDPNGGFLGKSGLQKWDIILHIAGCPIRSAADLHKATRSIAHGSHFSILVVRQGRRMTLHAVRE